MGFLYIIQCTNVCLSVCNCLIHSFYPIDKITIGFVLFKLQWNECRCLFECDFLLFFSSFSDLNFLYFRHHQHHPNGGMRSLFSAIRCLNWDWIGDVDCVWLLTTIHSSRRPFFFALPLYKENSFFVKIKKVSELEKAKIQKIST